MAYISPYKGTWRAQVNKQKVRASRTFETREEAVAWADNIENQILGAKSGGTFQLTSREFVDLVNRAKERAKVRGIPYHLTRQDIEAMYAKSGGRCAVSGIQFNRFRPLNSTKRPWYPSLDRIDSSKPYTPDNCRFVCVAANIAMGGMGRMATEVSRQGYCPRNACGEHWRRSCAVFFSSHRARRADLQAKGAET